MSLGPQSFFWSTPLEAYDSISNRTTTTRTGKCSHNCPSKPLIISSHTLISTMFAQLHAYAPRFGCQLNFGSSETYKSCQKPTKCTSIIPTQFYLPRICCNTQRASWSQVLCSRLLSTPCGLISPRCPVSEIWIYFSTLATVRERYPHWKGWVLPGG